MSQKREIYADDLIDAESLAQAMVDGMEYDLNHFIQNVEQHVFQIGHFDKNARSLKQLENAKAKAENLRDYLSEVLETLGRKAG